MCTVPLGGVSLVPSVLPPRHCQSSPGRSTAWAHASIIYIVCNSTDASTRTWSTQQHCGDSFIHANIQLTQGEVDYIYHVVALYPGKKKSVPKSVYCYKLSWLPKQKAKTRHLVCPRPHIHLHQAHDYNQSHSLSPRSSFSCVQSLGATCIA